MSAAEGGAPKSVVVDMEPEKEKKKEPIKRSNVRPNAKRRRRLHPPLAGPCAALCGFCLFACMPLLAGFRRLLCVCV